MRQPARARRRPCPAAWLFVLFVLEAAPALARPEYMVKFQSDAMRRPEANGCGTCHVKPEGGGARNDFGTAFDAANRDITPLLRATFPQHFTVTSAKLPDGTTFHMADPASKVVVVEREGQKVVANVADIAAPKAAPLPPPDNRMTFFVSSRWSDNGGHLGGLAGADRVCQDLAAAAGAGDRPWRAYLSTSFKGQPSVNAGDRIGGGPWHNAKGELIARGPLDLHQREPLAPSLLLTEKGEPVAAGARVFTGTRSSGLADVDKTCNNWTSNADGHTATGGSLGGAWNTNVSVPCAPASAMPLRLYCFSPR